MKLDEAPQFPLDSQKNDAQLIRRLFDLFRATNQKVNRMAVGNITEFESANTAAPTSGKWTQGDRIKNTTPTELGGVGNKYVITGWICIVSGEPGTWVQMRSLTGN